MRDEDKTREQLIEELRELRRGHAPSREMDFAALEQARVRLESILPLERDMDGLELADVIDSRMVQSLMDDFYKFARIPMALIDVKGRVLVGVGWQDICVRFHRRHPETCRNCIESDTQLTRSIPPGEFERYQCKNNMWDIATPVMVGDRQVGSVFSGQFFFDDEEPDYELFRSQARKYGFDEAEYMAALDRVPRLSRNAVETGMAFFMKLAHILSRMSYSNANLARALSEGERMARELRDGETRFRLLSETAGRLLSASNPQEIVNELCRKVMDHLDCQAFFNFLVDERAGRLHLNAYAGIPGEEAREIEWLDYGTAVCGCAAQLGERIVVEDIFSTSDIRTDLVKTYGIQAYACHPLMVQGRLIGTLSFGTTTRKHFSPEDLALMKTVADQVAVAMDRMELIENLRWSRDELEQRVQERTAELKTYMAKLEASNQALQDFASIASHDLQEPLRKVASFGCRIRDKCGVALEDEGRDYMERLLNATERMQSLLDSLLQYSRISTRSEPFREVDLNRVFREVVSDLEVRLEKTGGSVEAGELPVINAEPTQMRQLFQNLIGNGLKFHKEGVRPVVKVRGTLTDAGELRIVVEDNGIGFDEKHLEKVFAPFQRLHGRSSRYEGAGMGLAICKRIVERHGGSITANSMPGEGSAFIVTLPRTHGGTE
ncbi:MAG: PocR ligand-binding domain-containing protein [Acidobacteriota bacterium]